MILNKRLAEDFQENLLLGLDRSCSRDGRLRLSRSFCQTGMIPDGEEHDRRASKTCFGRSLEDMDAMELMNASCLCDIKKLCF